jgi:hypothetical protein
MRTSIRRASWPTTLLLPAVLLLAGCGEADATSEPAAIEDDADRGDAAGSTDDGTTGTGAASDEVDGPEAAEEEAAEDGPVPFDPDAEIHLADIEVREWGVGEVERPWEVLILPDDFVVPATARQVTWAPPEEPFDGSRRHGGSGAFHVHQADPDEVAAFFSDRLPDLGWELTDDEPRGGAWTQTWVTLVPFDGWPEDWMADERAVQVEMRFTYVTSDGADAPDTLQMFYRAENVHHRWDG